MTLLASSVCVEGVLLPVPLALALGVYGELGEGAYSDKFSEESSLGRAKREAMGRGMGIGGIAGTGSFARWEDADLRSSCEVDEARCCLDVLRKNPNFFFEGVPPSVSYPEAEGVGRGGVGRGFLGDLRETSER